jgi:hypothetical protein
MKVDSLPQVFAQYNHLVDNIRKQGAREWSSSCPKCGGDDRCRWFLDDKPLGWCRQCLSLFWPDGGQRWTPAEMESWRRERIAEQERKKAAAEKALAYLRDSRTWERYHAQLNEHGRQLWYARGLDDDWQNWYEVGYCADWHGSPTLTIPYFDDTRELLNIKHRLLNVTEHGGKYRYELSGQGVHLYLTDTTATLGGHVIAIEGEIKAMVTFAVIQDGTVVGIPGSSMPEYLLKQFDKCDRITLVLDPGAEEKALRIAEQLGASRCRVLIPPMKIDDGILSAGLRARDVRYLINQAVPVE